MKNDLTTTIPKPKTKKQKQKLAYQLSQNINQAKRNIARNYLWLGKFLDIFQEYKLWEHYGEDFKNFEEFLEDMQIKRSTAYHSMAVYRQLGDIIAELDTDVAFRRLIKILPLIKGADYEKKCEWIRDAQELRDKDFKDQVREAKDKITSNDCEHPEERRQYFYQCKKCRGWVKIDAPKN